jgi:hypothetical protein
MQMCSSSSSRLVHGLEADGGRGRSQTTKGKTRQGQGRTDYDGLRDRLQYLDLRLETSTELQRHPTFDHCSRKGMEQLSPHV